jgi:hypothetical protein
MARTAAPTVEAEGNASSSPVCEAASGVRPPGAALASRQSPGHGASPTTPHREEDRRHLQDCATGCDLHSGDTPCIQNQESIAVSTAQNPGGLGQRGDDVVDDLAFANRIAILERDIKTVTADEPDTKHNRFHVQHTRRAQRPGRRLLGGNRPPNWPELAERPHGDRSAGWASNSPPSS